MLFLLVVGSMLSQYGHAVEFEYPELDYDLSVWPEDGGYGNHRVIVNHINNQSVGAVVAEIPWRRRDLSPEKKLVRVLDSRDGKEITNVVVINSTNEIGIIAFQPTVNPVENQRNRGEYEIYYLPFELPTGVWGGNWDIGYPRGAHMETSPEPDTEWVKANKLTPADIENGSWKELERVEILGVQANGEIHSFYPMEIIATQREMMGLLAEHLGENYFLFPEDRENPIKMFEYLPMKWIQDGPEREFYGIAQPGEYYVFQIGVWAARKALKNVQVHFPTMRCQGNPAMTAAEFSSINLSGVDWFGQPMKIDFSMARGKVRPIWVGVQIPAKTRGLYTGICTVTPEGEQPKTIKVTLDVAGKILSDHGDGDVKRLSRLRWLNSRRGLDDGVVAPFTPLEIDGATVSCLNRTVKLNDTGLPSSITSNGSEILAAPITMTVKTAGGDVSLQTRSEKNIKESQGIYKRRTVRQSDSLKVETTAHMEFDGSVTFNVKYTALEDIKLSDISLQVPYRRCVATYMMGMKRLGDYRPAKWDWEWDSEYNDSMLWIGEVEAGMQLALLRTADIWSVRPEKDGFPQPVSWSNHKQGGCSIREHGDTVLVTAFSGARSMKKGDEVLYRFRLLITPFKPINPKHWDQRFHPLADGGTIHQLHQGVSREIPNINYPFTNLSALRKFIQKNESLGGKVMIYYTIGSLSIYAAELFPLMSLGNELVDNDGIDIFQDEVSLKVTDSANDAGALFRVNPNIPANKLEKLRRGYPWLIEHLKAGYSSGWWTPLPHDQSIFFNPQNHVHYYYAAPRSSPRYMQDAAIGIKGLSRWQNYYVESLDWLGRNVGVDGLYLDGIGFSGKIMQRLAKTMSRANDGYYYLNFHGGNLFDMYKVSTLNWHLEHLPYITQLYLGEGYRGIYKDGSPATWLVEYSGIPFGLTSGMYWQEMNRYRAMLYGSTGNHDSNMWRFWDDVGIQNSEMIGYWKTNNPVKTGHRNVLATVYKMDDKAMVAMASWAKEEVTVTLQIDKRALGLKSELLKVAKVRIDPAGTSGDDSFALNFTEMDKVTLSVKPADGAIVLIKD